VYIVQYNAARLKHYVSYGYCMRLLRFMTSLTNTGRCADADCTTVVTVTVEGVDPPAASQFSFTVADDTVDTVLFAFYSISRKAVVLGSCPLSNCTLPTLTTIDSTEFEADTINVVRIRGARVLL
jgi:hypothetical protein